MDAVTLNDIYWLIACIAFVFSFSSGYQAGSTL